MVVAPSADARPFDAVLLVSFGGPEQPDDVVPFLENVTRGRGIPRERLVEVGEHYFAFGGRSPINDQNRDLLAAIRADLSGAGLDLPVYWGNRNWDPYLTDAVEQMRADGVQHAACFVTSAYSSYSGCRQYRENLHDALASVGGGAPRLSRLRHYFNHPGFVEPFVDATVAALADLPDDVREDAEIAFVTHSIPDSMNEASGRHDGAFGGAYVHQHVDAATEVARGVHELTDADREFRLVYCSRSGDPRTPWLEPDVNDHLRERAAAGVRAVVLVPIGFVSDHMEVVYDLDTEARETADELGIEMRRARTPGVDPRFVGVVRDLLLERAGRERGERPSEATVGSLGPSWDLCPVGCCANPREDRPAACGAPA